MSRPAGLPAGTRLGRVRLQVADLDRSLGFYRDGIGLGVVERRDGVARLGAGGGSDGPVLLELVEEPGARPVPRTGLLGIYHFALLLPTRSDLGRFLRHQAREGVPFGAADHAFSEALYLEDPDGITLEVYADRPREEWPVSEHGAEEDRPGQPLPLVSDPIDGAGLMAAAGDAEWDGVPPDSVVGHLHFFIDDLDAADAFYVRGLGFEPMIDVPTALFVAAGGYHHHIGLNTWRAGAPTATDEDARLLDWELVVPDAGARDGVVNRLREAGFEVEEEPITARDPWGITVRITGSVG